MAELSVITFAVTSTQEMDSSTGVGSGDLDLATLEVRAVVTCSGQRLVFRVVLMLVILALGLIGNALSIATFWSQRGQKASMLLLIMLAALDSLVLLLQTAMHAAPELCRQLRPGAAFLRRVYPYMVAYVWPVNTVCHMAATWTVVGITWQRYVAVCAPYRLHQLASVRLARVKVVCIVGCSVAFNLPRFFDDVIVDRGDAVVVKLQGRLSATGEFIYMIVLYNLLIYVIPFALLIFMTSRLVRALWRHRRMREQMTHSRLREWEQSVMLLTVVFVFMVCQLTNPVRRGLAAGLGTGETCGSVYFHWRHVHALITMLNSSTNFLIYCLLSRHFRRRLTRLFCARAGDGEEAEGGGGARVGPATAAAGMGGAAGTAVQAPGRCYTRDTPLSASSVLPSSSHQLQMPMT